MKIILKKLLPKKILSYSVLFFCCTIQFFAVDMELGFQWDTYSSAKEYGVPGFSFLLTENLSENIKMSANIENLYALNYNAKAGVEISGKYFMIAPSFLFALRSGKISPGISLNGMINFGSLISLAAYTNFAFSPSYFSSNSLIDVKSAIIFHTKNSDIELSYKYAATFNSSGTDSNHSAKLDVLAFEYGFPFKIDIFFGAGGYKESYDASYFDLDVDVGGALLFDFQKGGRYTLKGECEPFRMLRTSEEKVPFAISLTVGFTLE